MAQAGHCFIMKREGVGWLMIRKPEDLPLPIIMFSGSWYDREIRLQ
jgi:hypothetical protein